MASGFEKFRAFCCEAELDESTRDVIAMPSGLVSDDEEDDEVETGDDELLTNVGSTRRNQSNADDSHPRRTISTPSKETSKAATNKPPQTGGQPNDQHGTAANDEREHHP
ncbi:hypothetical protein MHU86_23874 [Fragilaria crotonensis]|nr:hypothetical protein MHU86_23874 [Fragilaria crotonensis]